MDAQQTPTTITYSEPDGLHLQFDLYLPANASRNPLPVFVYFHSGGLFHGQRTDILKELKDDLLERSWAFISASYRLLIPCSAHDILADTQQLFTFIQNNLNAEMAQFTPLRISTVNVFAGGYSGGGYLAMQSGRLAAPLKPRGVFLLSAQGGKYLDPWYFTPHIKGAKLNPANYERYTNRMHLEHPPAVAEAPFKWKRNPDPTDWRAIMPRLLGQLGTRLDVLTGVAGIGERLRSAHEDPMADLEEAVPEELRWLFPELMIGPGYPPTYAVHGTGDNSVMVRESENIVQKIREWGGEAELVLLENWGHVYERAVRGVINFFEARITPDDIIYA